jgi:formamidopyrimidine-DNA glycosylase
MPELPEVECLTRSVASVIAGWNCTDIDFYRDAIRDPIPKDKLREVLVGQKIERVYRRSKYLLMETAAGIGVVHLGMTGNLLNQDSPDPSVKHTHVVFQFGKGKQNLSLHYVDPRRFGRISALFPDEITDHEWFCNLGPEPLETVRLSDHLFKASRKKMTPVKSFLMDPNVVVGVGNIYACESLFLAGINPLRQASDLSQAEYSLVASAIKKTLKKAIAAGGTTFRDFKNSDGSAGYFAIDLNVYDRSKDPCLKCGNPVKMERVSGRSTFFCSFCQN